MGTLLLDEYPLLVDRKLAKRIGLHEAIILQQIHYWIKQNEKARRNYYEGAYWTFNTYREWQEQFPFWSESTVKRTINKLEKEGYLISGNFNKFKMDRTKWYRIDYKRLETPEKSDSIKMTQRTGRDDTMTLEQSDPNNTRDYSDTYTENSFYITLPCDDKFLSLYAEAYRQWFHKEHPKVTEEQLESITKKIDALRADDVSFERWKTEVVGHFRNLPKSNNGNIISFLTATKRYFDSDAYLEG